MLCPVSYEGSAVKRHFTFAPRPYHLDACRCCCARLPHRAASVAFMGDWVRDFSACSHALREQRLTRAQPALTLPSFALQEQEHGGRRPPDPNYPPPRDRQARALVASIATHCDSRNPSAAAGARRLAARRSRSSPACRGIPAPRVPARHAPQGMRDDKLRVCFNRSRRLRHMRVANVSLCAGN